MTQTEPKLMRYNADYFTVEIYEDNTAVIRDRRYSMAPVIHRIQRAIPNAKTPLNLEGMTVEVFPERRNIIISSPNYHSSLHAQCLPETTQ